MRPLESLDPEIQKFLQTEAPDITIVESQVALVHNIESYDLNVFGEENTEKMKAMLELARDWLASPLFHDECTSDVQRAEREELARDKYSEKVHKFMLSGRSRPSHVAAIYPSIIILLDLDERSGKNLFDPQVRVTLKVEINNIIDEFKVINDIEHCLDDTQAKIWRRLPDFFTDQEIEQLHSQPRPLIRERMEGLMKELEAVALEVLQKLPRKG